MPSAASASVIPAHPLQLFLDARVRRDKASPFLTGVVCVGVRGVLSNGRPLWWVCELAHDKVSTRFAAERPARSDVVVGLDEDSASRLLGLPTPRRGLELIAGDTKLFARFVERYLREHSPLRTRLASSSSSKKGGRAR